MNRRTVPIACATCLLMFLPFAHGEGPSDFLVDQLDVERFKQTIADLAAFESRYWNRPGNEAAVRYIAEKLESFGYANVVLDPYEFEDTVKHNIYATRVGCRRPNEMYILGAHMDSTNRHRDFDDAPGADDDASGTASVLEIARVFATACPDVSVRFILFNNEETGLNGSRAYVANHRDQQGTPEEPAWLGMIQQDMILFDHGPGKVPDADVEYQVKHDFDGAALALANTVAAAMDCYGTMPAEVGDNMNNTDSRSFWDDAPAVSVRENQRIAEIGNGSNPHYHEPTDLFSTYSQVDYAFGFNIVRMVAGAVGDLTVVRPCGGDHDADSDVDLEDHGALAGCFTGEGGEVEPPCEVFDFDCDGDVDLGDFRRFKTAFDGPR